MAYSTVQYDFTIWRGIRHGARGTEHGARGIGFRLHTYLKHLMGTAERLCFSS